MEIQIPRAVHSKIMHWVNKSDDEVSFFGKVIYHEETKVFEIVDVHMLKQSNGAAHTDIDAAALAKLMYTTKDNPGELRYWGHSHSNMQVFWSGTDTNTIKELASQGWILATVFNKKQESRSAVGFVTDTPFGTEVTIKDELPLFIIDEGYDTAAWDKEYDDNVEKKVTRAYNYLDYSYRDDWKFNDNTLLDKPTKNKHNKSVDPNKEYNDYLLTGWWGYGAEEEAKAIGMRVNKYVNILVYGSRVDIDELDRRLEQAIKEGKLDA